MSSHSLALVPKLTTGVEPSPTLQPEDSALFVPSMKGTGFRFRLTKRVYRLVGDHPILIDERFLWGGNRPEEIDRTFRSFRGIRLPLWRKLKNKHGVPILKMMICLEEKVSKWVEPRFVEKRWYQGYLAQVWQECEDPRHSR